MENREAIELIKRVRSGDTCPLGWETLEAFDMAISALEKQEQDKSCETCKHENLTLLQSPCRDCYRSTSMFEDYYEPYTEEES